MIDDSTPAAATITSPRLTTTCVWAVALLSLAPLVAHHRYFSDLMWFGDEWDLLDQISRQGFAPWILHVFAENFVPLFKVLWGGLAMLGAGSYLGMLTVLWLTHMLVVAMLGYILRDARFGLVSILFTLSTFGLASCNVETLAWSVQWSAVLACLFFGMAVVWFNRRFKPDAPLRVLDLAVLALLCAASALSFSRGVLTGAVIATLCFVGPPDVIIKTWRRRVIMALACILPGIATSLVIVLLASGNHKHLLEDHHLWEAIRFGATCFGLNPFLRLLGFGLISVGAGMIASVLKLTLIAHGLLWSKGNVFRVLLMLLLFDVGSCILLGIGRYHTGLDAAISSRYQYTSLICTLPFLGIAMERLLALIHRPSPRLVITGIGLFTLTYISAHHWSREIRAYSGWRGREIRYTLFVNPQPAADNALPGISSMSTARAKQLVEEYNLH